MSSGRDDGVEVPVYKIDLSKAPADRYTELASAYAIQLRELTSLFDILLFDLGISHRFHKYINGAARLLLRGVWSLEETAELRGIARVSGVSMYLLVSLNVILDLLMGCTSGAVRSKERNQPVVDAKMLHFRTLDWGMDPLRDVIVQLDFVRSRSANPEAVLASSITYVGFVGILTGVRPGLSMSLNFRAIHNGQDWPSQFKFYMHHLLVLLGRTQSISSLLRSYLFERLGDHVPGILAELTEKIPTKRSTAAYLTFSDGGTTVTMEKDYKTAVVRQSNSFIVVTNNDEEDRSIENALNSSARTTNGFSALMELVAESFDRRRCIEKKWQREVRKAARARGTASEPSVKPTPMNAPTTATTSMELRSRNQLRLDVPTSPPTSPPASSSPAVEETLCIPTNKVIDWVSAHPTTNECTHFAVVLDPREGRVVWVRRYTEEGIVGGSPPYFDE